ncbi:MAG: sigma-70 family RNA polymerase sigma factor [Bacteroidetes bacterium]|nr:sigma-70 family RNA polymerase sigma factor [Bacteroidota bacterium]
MTYTKRHIIAEETLVELLKQQNTKAFGILYDNYSAALYGIILRIVTTQEIAEDVLQEAFLKIWKNFSQYDSGKGKLFTWMVNLTRNLAIDKVRSKDFSNNTKNQAIDPIVSFVDFKSNTSQNPDLIGLKTLVEALDPEQKKLIDLLYFGGFTQVEVSEKLGIPLGTVKTRARMALLNLRKHFEYTTK